MEPISVFCNVRPSIVDTWTNVNSFILPFNTLTPESPITAHVQKYYRYLFFIFMLKWKLNMHLWLFSLKISYLPVNGFLSLELVFRKTWFTKIYCALCLLLWFLQIFKFWIGMHYTLVPMGWHDGPKCSDTNKKENRTEKEK